MPRYPSRFTPIVTLEAPRGLRGASVPQYPDRGCEFGPSCLNCTLPQCVLDMTREEVAALRARGTAAR